MTGTQQMPDVGLVEPELAVSVTGDKKVTGSASRILVDAIRACYDRLGFSAQVADMVVAADAGMLSDTYLAAIDATGRHFIVGSKQTKAPRGLVAHFHHHAGGYCAPGVDTSLILPDSTFPSNRCGSQPPMPFISGSCGNTGSNAPAEMPARWMPIARGRWRWSKDNDQ